MNHLTHSPALYFPSTDYLNFASYRALLVIHTEAMSARAYERIPEDDLHRKAVPLSGQSVSLFTREYVDIREQHCMQIRGYSLYARVPLTSLTFAKRTLRLRMFAEFLLPRLLAIPNNNVFIL
jgi:hypothetical protein